MNFTINSPLSANIFSAVRNDSRLQAGDKLFLYTIFDHLGGKDSIDITLFNLSRETSLEKSAIKKSLQHLIDSGWLKKCNDNSYLLLTPEPDNRGELLIKSWPEIFGTRQLTPFTYRKLQAFLEDGLQEELIIEVMKISAKQAARNPFNYCQKILSDLRDRDIKTLKQLEKERGQQDGKQISGRTGKDKKRTPERSLQELYKKGYQ